MDGLDNNKDYFDMGEDDKSIFERKPQDMNFDIFSLRNNPEKLIEDFYLYLTAQRRNQDTTSADKKPYVSLGGNTKALLNSQGVSDLVNLLTFYINGHIVQTNLDKGSHVAIMRFIADELSMFIVDKREEWKLDRGYADNIKNQFCNKVDLFLRRGLDDKERTHYDETLKEEYSRTNNGTKKAGRLQGIAENMFKR
jgi:hypothetical protein